ncbi:hypothetical protein ACWD25_22100 [Streptomyces sp. NPDC002920]
MNEIFGINPGDAGAAALLVLVVLLILTGRLIPRRTHEDVIADRDNWRTAFMESEAVRQRESQQVEELLEMAKLGGHILNSLPKPGTEEVNDDPMDQAPRARR